MSVKSTDESMQADMPEVSVPVAVQTSGRKKSTKKTDSQAGGFCVYIGPGIRGVIQSGTVYRGTKDDALAQIGKAVESYPLIASLVVSGETLAADRIKVKTAGNLLYVNYMKLASGTM